MGHGSETSNFELSWLSEKNLKKTAKFTSHNEYCGLGLEDKKWTATKSMLSRLAQRMDYGPQGALPTGGSNSETPAGYTYFGQLVAHDLVATGGAFPQDGISRNDARNFRQHPLVLDCIYGGGPDLNPNLYAHEKDRRLSRRKLRLGKTRRNGQPFADSVERDIPRIACPYMSGFVPESAILGNNQGSSRLHPTDVLLADARNDDNLVLSQLTALFHVFHNKVLDDVDEVRLSCPAGTSNAHDHELRRNFDIARRIVTRTYRRIIRSDFLNRVLMTEVNSEYNFSYNEAIKGNVIEEPVNLAKSVLDFDKGRIPIEFTHAVYRFGHGMINNSYELNALRSVGGAKKLASLQDIVEFTSSRKPGDMPLSCDWLVDDWWRFFDCGNSSVQKFNPSRLITPFVASQLVIGSHFQLGDQKKGNLMYRDFVRAASVGVRSVDSLIQDFRLATQPGYMFANKSDRQKIISDSLDGKIDSISVDERLTIDDIKNISSDPPLLYFILLESEKTQGGKCLGALGSMITAGVIYYALEVTNEIDKADYEIEKIEREIFQEGAPKSIPEMIKWMNVVTGWSNCNKL